ncbi:MAG: OsmC family protein [Phycisphaerales bacterium]|nr:MAG: OsmC family protein [Phycisphaerales bacterium]
MSAEDPNVPGIHRNGASATIGKGTRTEIIMANGHSVVADQPPYQDGTNEGPTPVDLMLAALCSCKASAMGKFAERKGYAMESATVFARWVKSSKADVPDTIQCEVNIVGDLSDEERKRIYAASRACAVQKIFAAETNIESVVTDTPTQPSA